MDPDSSSRSNNGNNHSIAISFEIGLRAALEKALKRCIFRLASAHFKSKRLYSRCSIISDVKLPPMLIMK